MTAMKSFASVDRFLAEIATPSLRPGYVLVGDEVFLYDRCRRGVLSALVPPDFRDFCLHDLDLADSSIFEILDRAQTPPSLMAPFQVFFIRGSQGALHARREEGRVRGHRRLLPQPEPASSDPLRRRPSPHPHRPPQNGHAG